MLEIIATSAVAAGVRAPQAKSGEQPADLTTDQRDQLIVVSAVAAGLDRGQG